MSGIITDEEIEKIDKISADRIEALEMPDDKDYLRFVVEETANLISSKRDITIRNYQINYGKKIEEISELKRNVEQNHRNTVKYSKLFQELKIQFDALENWIKDINRKKSNIAFTDGELRRIACLIEEMKWS